MGEPSHVLGDWHHVPRLVTVIGPKGKRRAEVKTHQHWSILETAHSELVQWRVMFMFPTDAARDPVVVFEDRDDAKDWADTPDVADVAPDIEWTPPSGAETAVREKVEHHSLILYSKYDGDGEHYEVPAVGGVADWPGKKPHGAAIPNWLPRSFETFEQNDRVNLYGHSHGKPSREQHLYAVGIQRSNLPFPVLDSASSKY
jgi:hypothetical protein